MTKERVNEMEGYTEEQVEAELKMDGMERLEAGNDPETIVKRIREARKVKRAKAEAERERHESIKKFVDEINHPDEVHHTVQGEGVFTIDAKDADVEVEPKYGLDS